MKIIDGKAIALEIKNQVRKDVETLLEQGKNAPTLACILIEGDRASEVYVKNKVKACEECKIKSRVIRLKNDITEQELAKQIEMLNKDKSVSGILLQLPLPKHLDEKKAINLIDKSKDVDCLNSQNLGLMFTGVGEISPCTATAVMEILKHEKIETTGKRAVVVGRSLLVGKSSAVLLEEANATVTLCHSKTQNLKEICKTADILVVAIGKPNFITKEHIKKGTVVIDVGINKTADGLKGDVNFESVKNVCSFITPVPGGVGPLTVACLMKNTYILHKLKT